ncbi:MAG TPA: hypothetical protein VGX23_35525 [Actinocrinis sp.]|nr:hypothetical protein [Actinocrinis sp.]
MAFTMEVYGGEDDDRKVADAMAQLILPAALGPSEPEEGGE